MQEVHLKKVLYILKRNGKVMLIQFKLYKIERLHNITVPISTIKTFGETNGLSFDDDDINYYTELYGKIGRNPTSSELYDLSQELSQSTKYRVSTIDTEFLQWQNNV